jgi:hypothetical protein
MVGSSRNSTGLVQQRGDEFHLHAFAQGEFADLTLSLSDAEQFGHFGDGAFDARVGDAVDAGVEFEGFAGGQIPPELVLLAEQQRELAAVTVFAFPRHIAQHRASPPVGYSRPASILSVVVLPAPFGPRKPTSSPGLDGS